MTLSFLIGISLSFLLSSLYVRWRAIFAAFVSALVILIAGSYVTKAYTFSQIIPSIMFQQTGDLLYLVLSLILIIVFSYLAVSTIKIRFGKATERYPDEIMVTAKRFSFTRSYAAFMAKDWIDLIRSKTLSPVIGAYVGPLAFLALLFWFLGGVLMLPLHFNLIFYGTMIGFFGVSVYGWLNLLDTTAFLEVLPTSVARLIRTRLLLFSMLAGVISTIFLLLLSILQAEIEMLWIGLIAAYATTCYTVTFTAYLTGLRTNSYLFDPKILARFVAVIIPPLIALTILSFNYEGDKVFSSAAILSLSAILVVVTYLLYRRIDKRWGRESFVI
jgi:hypothetical protein